MRIEKAVANLIDLSKQPDVSPSRLARLYILTLKKVADTSPAGGEALKLVQSRFLRDALSTELPIQRIRRRKYMGKKVKSETTPISYKEPRKRRGVAKEQAEEQE